MRLRRKILATSMALALLAAACGGGDDGEQSTSGGGDADLTIWTSGDSAPRIQAFADTFAEEHGITVSVQSLPGTQLRSQFQLAAPAGEGPDLVEAPHDWLGELAANGVLAPIDLGPLAEDFLPVTLDAFTLGGQLYGVPFGFETLVLYRNTDLVPEAPATWEEMEETALRLEQEGTVEDAFLIPASQAEAPYFNFPILTAHGGYIFGQNEDGDYDPQDVGLDSPGSIAAGNAVASWVDDGLINTSVTGSLLQEIFSAGDAAFAITGPWALRTAGQGFLETGVPFDVTPIPPIDGGEALPPVGVRGFMQSSFSENPLLARSFLLEVMADEDSQVELSDALARPPALKAAYERALESTPQYEAFGEAAEVGFPMPAIPEMATVWGALGQAWALVYQGSDPTEAFENAGEQVRTATGAQ
jgi:maltose-binding protein MalE